MKDYLKEEIATYREIVKLIVIIIVALIGSMISFAIKFLESQKSYYLICIMSFITLILFFVILVRVCNKMYEFKFRLKDNNE